VCGTIVSAETTTNPRGNGPAGRRVCQALGWLAKLLEENPMLEIGTAPRLSLVNTIGQAVTLDGGVANTGTFIYFMRALSCVQCNAAVAKLAKEQAAFTDAGVRVIVAVPEDRDAAAQWKAKKGVPFEVVTGQSGTAHEEVGLMKKVFGLVQQSGNILLDADGVVRYAHASTNPGASYNAAAVATAVAALPRAPHPSTEHVPASDEPTVPELEEDETIAPRPEEEIADALRAKPDVTDHSRPTD
jgi:peroxiredoxin